MSPLREPRSFFSQPQNCDEKTADSIDILLYIYISMANSIWKHLEKLVNWEVYFDQTKGAKKLKLERFDSFTEGRVFSKIGK
jgi:hypothetical protein